MISLLAKLKNNPEFHHSVPKNSRLVLALSGGIDSVVLSHLFLNMVGDYSYTLTLGHVNHGLRENSARDMQFVGEIAKKWNLQIEIEILDPQFKKSNESTEAWARTYRYKALEKICEKVKGDYILTAHHKSDQAETILMRLAQGTGVRGFRGIHTKFNLIRRPLLQFSKQELIHYAEIHNLPYVEDETNINTSIPRNFIRHNLLKPWEIQEKNIENRIIKTSEHIIELLDSVKFTIEYFVKKIVQKNPNNTEQIISKVDLNQLPSFIRYELIKRCLDGDDNQWRQHQWTALKSFIKKSSTGDIFTTKSSKCILNNRNEWVLSKLGKTEDVLMEIIPNGKTICDPYIFNWEWTTTPAKIVNINKHIVIIDGGMIQNKKLELRHWKHGDWFQPLGMKGKKKISDLLIDNKVNRFDKSNQLVLTADHKIAWVCGHQISDWVKVTKNTLKPAKISVEAFS
jgi:tRNA(Ile)-lysidine synthase